jgi:glucose/arabinose dehydrogenase
MLKEKLLLLLAGIIVVAWAGWLLAQTEKTSEQILEEENAVEVIAKGLEVPWSIVFLPSGEMLIAERPGRVRLIEQDGKLRLDPVAVLPNVKAIGEGGLLGMALDPDFTENKLVYVYYTYEETEGETLNRVTRMTYDNGSLGDEEIIVDQIPGSQFHNGGRLKFGPDKYLYITTGDAQEPSRAQDTNSLAGKILRVTIDGKPVADNPFGNEVYSYGHRNPQGLAWDEKGNLWSTEHGRSGILSGLDEINLIEKGNNYGWPTIQGDETEEGMMKPILHSGNLTTWAPAGVVFLNNSIFFGGLRGQALYEAEIQGDQLNFKKHFDGEFGRIREVTIGLDGLIYLTTSNRDGRGDFTPEDDRVIKIGSF